MRISLLFLLISTSLATAFSNNKDSEKITEYNLSLNLIPGSGHIKGSVEIINPPDSLFTLSSYLKVSRVVADNREVAFRHRQATGQESVNIWSVGMIPGKMVIEWEGNIIAGNLPKQLSNYNLISHNLVELTDHIIWYPHMKITGGFRFTLRTDLPREYTVITNGQYVEEVRDGESKLTTWRSEKPVYNITFLAVRNMKISKASEDGFSLEIYYSSLPVSYIDSMKNDLMETLRLYTRLYGTHKASDQVRIVYSPRTAGGYARAPLIVVSEYYASDQRHMAYGFARDFHLNAHEMAHYWSKADTWSADDWINEGMAEYSALLASENIIGKDFSDLLVNEYIGIVNSSDTRLSVLETPGDSWELNINRYYKPALMLNGLRQKYGDDRFFAFLRSLDSAFVSSGATTHVFLEVLDRKLGNHAYDYMTEALNRQQWMNGKSSTEGILLPADTVFRGTWSGKLTQFGTAAEFVLQLKKSNGNLVPSLDSPDQNAFGIPATDLEIKGDTIRFSVGVASASFKGTLDRSKMLINGTWTQRGAPFPLVLLKSE